MSHLLNFYRRWWPVLLMVTVLLPYFVGAKNITDYKDVISTSAPGEAANHSLSFQLQTAVAPGAVIEITPPAGFEIIGSSTFSARNVELLENGIPRVASTTGSATVDEVEIIPGTPGMIRYVLNSSQPLALDSTIDILIGNQTSGTELESIVIASSSPTTTATTTSPGDIKPIINASDVGTHRVKLEIFEGPQVVANADFVIALVEQVGVGRINTRETIPPERSNGLPNQPVGGTTPFVEISLETNEFAICRWSTAPDVLYEVMPNTFDTPGHPFMAPYHIFHTAVVPVTPASFNQFYVRCIDEEDNENIDDFIIAFAVNELPTGQANDEGDVDGDGTGSGNDGSGDGSGGGGETGDSSGEAPELGGSAGTGGSGGGGGGGGGPRTGDTAGGGFESRDGPYRSGDGRVVISGFAYPRADVIINVDGNRAGTTRAGNDGAYEITLDEIARGVYTFGIFARGSNAIDSSIFNTSFTVSGARTSGLSNINIPPSILVQPDPVDPGTPATISGFSLPNSAVTIEYGRTGTAPQSQITTSDGNGRWTLALQTTGFTTGTYEVRAKAEQTDGIKTNFSQSKFFGVGQEADLPINADLNRDGKVNLVDFSILLFWWNSDGGTSDPSADINQDNRVNLTDFSILLFNWTG